MKYPKFLNKNSIVGITALSSGCTKNKQELEQAIHFLKTKYNIITTPNIYGPDENSSDLKTKIKELNYLLENKIEGLIISRGGDTQSETLDYIDYEKIVENNILVTGYSDPTSLLYILTTKYDYATIYGLNAKSYNETGLYIENNLKILNGENIIQKSYYDCISNDLIEYGMIIGGCIDVLKEIFNTKYDNTLNFIEKYKEYNIIYYFDIYDMSPIELIETLFYFYQKGYFKYTKLIIFSKVYNTKYKEEDYLYFINNILKDIKIIFNASIGHVKPVMTIINGSLAKIKVRNKKMELTYEVLDESFSE